MGPESPGGPKPAGLTEGAQITLIASETAAPSGATVRVDVYLIGVVDLRGYQITLTPGGGDSGELELIDLTIEPGRANGVFDGLDTYFAYDRFRGRLVSCLASGGVDGSSPQYLATFTYRLSADAVGSFRIEVPLDGTMLRDSGAQPIAIASAPSVEINVAAGHAGQTWPRKGETP